MKNPIQIHQFDPVIYPVKLWVCITGNLYPLAERFVNPSGKDFNPMFESKHVAFTQVVVEKETSFWGVLVVCKSKKELNIGTIAHEATHATREIWNRINEDGTGVEADAYLVEWIANCIEKAKQGKQ